MERETAATTGIGKLLNKEMKRHFQVQEEDWKAAGLYQMQGTTIKRKV